jgi:hypothetical protein
MGLLSQILPGTGRGTARAARGGGGALRSTTSHTPSTTGLRPAVPLPILGRI